MNISLLVEKYIKQNFELMPLPIAIKEVIASPLKNDNIRTLQNILSHDDDDDHCTATYVVFIVKNNFRAACAERLNEFVENFLKFDEERAKLFIEYIFNCKSDESIVDIVLEAMHYKVNTLKSILQSFQMDISNYMFDYDECKQSTTPHYKIITDSFLKIVTNVIKKLHFVALTSKELLRIITNANDESDDESDL